MIRQWKLDTITGNDSATSARPLFGRVLAIYLEYAVTPNAATDVTIATVNSPVKTILTVTDNNTSGWYYPREQIQDNTGTGLVYAATDVVAESIPVSDYIKATVAQGDNDQTLNVWVLLEE